MAHRDPTIGRMFGNVRITECIGRGAMGVVYKGFHERLGRDVAVKLLMDNGRKNARERFLREAKASAKVHHPNVVQILDAGEEHGSAYLVMELVEGHSLGSIVDGTGAMPPDVVTRLALGIARGLTAIHDCSIIHRDIKPDNILVGTDGVAKITDLGLAKQNDDPELLRLTATGVVVGTPLYVSPESIRDPKSITSATDIYSLGATLYHLLAGKPPFDSESSYEVMRAQLEARPRPLREIRPEIPAGLAQLVEQCLEKQAARRPTAKQLVDLLDHGARIQPGADRGLLVAIVLAVLIVLALAVCAWLVLARNRHDGQASSLPANASLTVRSSHVPAKVRVDQGSWRSIGDAPLPVPAGRHAIEVACDRPGPLLSWRGEVTVEAQHTQEVTAALATTPVNDVRVKAPGSGMAYVDGVAYGLEAEIVLQSAGVFAIGSWSGTAWASLTASVDASGRTTSTPSVKGDHPDGPAWWCSRDEDGRPMDVHHVVCWWEAEQIRLEARAQDPREWLEQGNRPAQAATRIPPPLFHELRMRFLERGMRLPSSAIATRLAVAYRAGIWSADGERPDVVGGSSATALMAVVPR